MKRALVAFTVVFIGLGLRNGAAQSIAVETPYDDYYRRMQLLEKVDPDVSFGIKPLSRLAVGANDIFDPDSSLRNSNYFYTGPLQFAKGHGRFQLLPVSIKQRYNSNYPFGWNDGAMIPARGYQATVTGGFYLKYGPLSIQLSPEYIYAENKPFIRFDSWHTGQDLINYHTQFNDIDMPERFGDKAYKRFFWGQSSIRLTFDPVSLGLSNENLWWGPGIHNALILTNNAPGFKHLTLNTTRPVKTFLGSFEAQIVAGRLDATKFTPLSTTWLPDGTPLYEIKRDSWRYFTGLNFNYHPKWIPSLSLGFTRTFNAYHDDVKGLKDYLPFFLTFFKGNTTNAQGDAIPRDQLTSIYARWAFPKEQTELYVEYGLGDNSYNLKDFMNTPEHSRAYIFGLRKLVSFNAAKNQHLQIDAEVTQTSQNIDFRLRGSALWYLNYQVTQGHTHEGQVLGAGTGPGGNIQLLSVSWLSGLKKLGVSFERYEHDVDLYQNYFPDINGSSRSWVDFVYGVNGQWSFKNILLTAKIKHVRSFNYQWILKNYDPNNYYIPNNDAYNFNAELGMMFRF